MTENTDKKEFAEPQAEILTEQSSQETIPEAEKEEITVPVKYNKEIRNLSVEEAGRLAQKGLKYSAIENDFLILKQMAAEDKKSIPEFIMELKNQRLENKRKALAERCNGDTELAERIIRLEEGESINDDGFSEVSKNFPRITSPDDLPEEVRENSKLKGTLLLDEYLRYRLKAEQKKREAEKLQEQANLSSAGSQLDRSEVGSPESEEFLRGLWR